VSLVAKVFVVLNLVISVTFMVFAMNIWTAQTKWQRMYEQEKKKNVEFIASAQHRERDLSLEVLKQTNINTDQKRQNQELRMKFNSERDAKQEALVKLATAENEKGMLLAENQEYIRENKRYFDDIVKLKGVVVKQQQAVIVERENAVRSKNEKSEMENELNVTKQTLAALTRDKRSIEEDLSLQTSRIERLLKNGVPVAQLLGEDPSATQPFISDGRVLGVKPEIHLVMLSIGSQQGVKPGYQYTVKRGDQYITKVQVEKVYPDMSSARYVDGLMNKEGREVEINDEVITR
jgi:hypothetical protein